MNEKLKTAIDLANGRGHVLASDHLHTARRWTCAACGLEVVSWPGGDVTGLAPKIICVIPEG